MFCELIPVISYDILIYSYMQWQMHMPNVHYLKTTAQWILKKATKLYAQIMQEQVPVEKLIKIKFINK